MRGLFLESTAWPENSREREHRSYDTSIKRNPKIGRNPGDVWPSCEVERIVDTGDEGMPRCIIMGERL